MAETVTLRDAFGRQHIKITDRNGKEHVLGNVDLFDLVDLEDDLGPVAEWADRSFSLKAWVAVFWLALRREGMTEEQVDVARASGKWSYVRGDINRLFGPENMMTIAKVAGDLMRNLGLVVNPNVHPTPAAAEAESATVAAPTGENSSEPPAPSVTA